MKLHDALFEEKIRAKAYELYECSDRAEGRDLDNWLEAEQIVSAWHVEYASQEDEEEAFIGTLFEGSDC